MIEIKKNKGKKEQPVESEREGPILTSGIGTRIGGIADMVGGNSSLARMCGFSESVIRKWRLEMSEPCASDLVVMARAANVTIEWLTTGEGNKHPPEATEDVGVEFVLVPRYNVEASAGSGSLVGVESEIGKLAFRRDWLRQKGLSDKDLVVIRVTGDSMSPTIRNGSLVLVDTHQEQVKEDGIYVVSWDGHLVAKRLQVDFAGGVYVISDYHEKYPERHLRAEEASSLYVIGRVVWAGGEV